MTKTLNISFISAFILAAFLLISVFAALPAGAQAVEGCTLVKGIDLSENVKISAGVTVVPGPDKAISQEAGELKTSQWGLICLVNTVNVVTDWLFIALLVVAVALIAIGGFMWMVARDSADKQKQAGQIIFAAVIGLIIAILARVIPGIVTGILL